MLKCEKSQLVQLSTLSLASPTSQSSCMNMREIKQVCEALILALLS